MSDIRVRLLGGFEVWSGDRQTGGSVPSKARVLLAYLLCQHRRSFGRDSLAALLWPDEEPGVALRELDGAIGAWQPLLPPSFFISDSPEIGISSRAGCWIDVEAFEEGLSRGTEREAFDLRHLSEAAQLYRGELLDGLSAEGCPGFEEWRATEQARLRAAALEVLRTLVESYGRRGEHRLGIHYARRRVAIEPFSEEAHRDLMRLFALSGQRNRALAQHDALLQRLHGDGRAGPGEETRALYESILAEALEREAATRDEPMGPLVPLAGREHAEAVLRDGWLRGLEGEVHLTLVTGEAGIGKTRLVKSFLDGVTSRRRTIVLKGRCEEMAPLRAYQPLLEALRTAFEDEEERAARALAALPAEDAADLARLLPELSRPEVPEPAPPAVSEARSRLFLAVGRFLEALGEGDPLVLFLDDLHQADQDTLDLLGFLAAHLDQGPIWIVAVCRSTDLDRDHPLEQMVRRGEKDGMATRLELDRLDRGALEEIARSLVGEAQTAELAGFLAERSAGLPFAVTELINVLWDEGLLAPGEAERWSLTGPLGGLDASEEDLEALVRRRARRLPNSTRRLASLAAVLGQSFDLELLQEAADEHIAVLEIGLEILLKRWLIRQLSSFWTSNRRERDVVVPRALRAHRGSFEFAHETIRRALYNELNPLRRQAIHGQVADALTALKGDSDCETLAWHLTSAGQWERALAPLEKAMERAQAVQAVHTARHYHEQWVEALTRLVASARNGAVAERWRGERERVEGLLEGT
ncbi:MAG TPA: AAA family ATPase [Thermoanaerobaculia bacterium]|nr:AAA family ATPase [Thermoanaerobaculia bacterium]